MAYSKVPLKISTGFDIKRSWGSNLQECLNMYLEEDPKSVDSKQTLLPTPGTRVIGSIGADPDGAVLGSYSDSSESFDILYVAKVESGSVKAIRLEFTSLESYTETTLGTLSTFNTFNPVEVLGDDNYIVFFELGVGRMYFWDKSSSTLSANTDPDYGPNQTPQIKYDTITYLDNYFICNERGTDRFWVSDINTPTSWTATSFARAEGRPDPITRVYSVRNELWLFGKNTIEVWTNSGNADFPFEPIPNAFYEFGCACPLSVTDIGGQIFLLSKDRGGFAKIISFDGFNPTVVSTPSIDYLISNNFEFSGISPTVEIEGFNVEGYSYTDAGHSFYILRIPSLIANVTTREPVVDGFGNVDSTYYSDRADSRLITTGIDGRSLVYDSSTRQWHVRRSYDYVTYGSFGQKKLGPWIASKIGFANNRHICFAGSDTILDKSKVLVLDNGTYSDFLLDDSEAIPILRLVNTPYFSNNRNRVFWLSVELDVEHPIGSILPGSSVFMSYTDDQGYTWSQAGSVTVSNLNKNRLKWRRLGKSRDRIYTFYTDSDTKFVISGIYAEIDAEDTQ